MRNFHIDFYISRAHLLRNILQLSEGPQSLFVKQINCIYYCHINTRTNMLQFKTLGFLSAQRFILLYCYFYKHNNDNNNGIFRPV
jgi:hypothetical protein